MYIKRLEIVGFKSFPERVLVPLSQGISAVVGPNGCGKSNIIDAIRWVMGEQSPKMLRGRNMDDILFNGSQGRPASALAEVTLTLARDAAPEAGYPTAAETSVTRRLYRSGDSEYLLNKIPCRLKDIVHFFTDHGVGTRAYGIIEQGRVGWLVDARPEERRGLIDEAAGITRYKQQKKEAERKIESAEANLANVSVIKAETKKQLDQITRAAAKAARFKALKEELRELDLTLSAKSLTALRARRAAADAEKEENKRLLTSLLAELTRHDLEMENLKLQAAQAENAFEVKTTAWHQLVAARDSLTKEAEYTRANLARAEARRVEALGELARISSERRRKLEEEAELSGEMGGLSEAAAQAGAESDRLREELAAVKSAFDALSRQHESAEQVRSAAEREAARLNSELAGAESLLSHHQASLAQLAPRKAEAEKDFETAEAKLAQLFARGEDLKLRLEGAAEAAEAAAEEAALTERRKAEARQTAAGAESRLTALMARLETLESVKSGFGWYPQGVKTLMETPELKEAGLIGPLAEFIKPPDGYEEAAEAALGERLAWLVVENRQAALTALEYADRNRLGRCGFICRDELALSGPDLTRALLGDYQLAEEILSRAEAAPVVLAKNGCYAGQGLVAGGRPESGGGEGDAGLLARLKEVERLTAESEKLSAEVKALNEAAGAAEEAALNAAESSRAAESARQSLAAALAGLEKETLVAENEMSQSRQKRQTILSGMAEAEKAVEDLSLSLSEGRGRRAEAEQKAAAAALEVESLKERLKDQGETLEDLRYQGEEARSRAAEAKARLERARHDLDRLNQWLEEVEDNLQARETETSSLAGEIEQLTAEAEELEKQAADFPARVEAAERELAEARAELESARQKQQSRETMARETRRRREDLNSVLTGQETEILSLGFALQKIEEDLMRDWQVIMPDAPPAESLEPEEPAQESEAPAAETIETQELAPANEADGDDAAENPAGLETAEDEEENEADSSPAVETVDPAELAARELPPDAESRRDALKTKIGSLGEVSLGAIEREAELSAEYERYQSQYDDLSRAIADLKDSINRINHTCRVRFGETFEAVNEKFREIFPILFEGGEGWLSLTDESDPLESGVEIHVHPPGKKVLVMSLLSGGEKALTALALIFALYLIKPSPFCLLDETDAPLDEANIDRFNRLLQNLSRASQIIMVTHNKRTMQISRTLYGVTMETPGVSRLVSVNLAEAEALTADV